MWVLIIKKLQPEEAIEKYGQVNCQEFGPQGGWKSVTYGSKKFVFASLKPSEKHFKNNKDYIEIVLEKRNRRAFYNKRSH